jgi:hypothetical protein
MRPGTPHYVLTLEDSVTLGRHFYSSSTVRATTWSLVHSGILDESITNTRHPETEQLLRRMFWMYVTDYSRSVGAVKGRDSPHSIDPRTTQGLLDIVALGNVLELSMFLDRRFWNHAVPPEDAAERRNIRLQYAAFQEKFSSNHRLRVGEQLLDPRPTLFKPSLHHLGVSLLHYKLHMREFDRAFTPAKLKTAILSYFTDYHRDLLDEVSADLNRPMEELDYCNTFEWSGPQFEIVPLEGGSV